MESDRWFVSDRLCTRKSDLGDEVGRFTCLIVDFWAGRIDRGWRSISTCRGGLCAVVVPCLALRASLSDRIVESHWSSLTRRWVLSPQRKLRGWRHRLRRIAAADKMRERRRSSASSAALRDGRNLKCKIGLFCDQLGFSTGLWHSAPALKFPSWQGNRPGA